MEPYDAHKRPADILTFTKAAKGLHLASFDQCLVQTSFADVKVIAQLQGLFPGEKI